MPESVTHREALILEGKASTDRTTRLLVEALDVADAEIARLTDERDAARATMRKMADRIQADLLETTWARQETANNVAGEIRDELRAGAGE